MSKTDIYQKKAIEMLSKLISFRSIAVREDSEDHPFGIENKKALDYILGVAAADGFSVYNASNYAGHIEYGEGEEILGIFGHLDVVKPDYPGEPAWDYDPWTLTRKRGKLIGRGVLDDKGGIVAAYIALLRMKDLGILPKKRIRLFVGCSEETGGGYPCLSKYLEEMPAPDLGFVVDSAFPVVNVANGMYDIDILVEDEIIDSIEAGYKYGVPPCSAEIKIAPTRKYLDEHGSNPYAGSEAAFRSQLEKKIFEGEVNDGSLIVRRSADSTPDTFDYNSAYVLFAFLSERGIPLADFVGKYLLFDQGFCALGFYQETTHPIWGHAINTLSIVDIHDHKGKIGIRYRAPDPMTAQAILNTLKEKAEGYGYSICVRTWEDNKRVDPESPLVKILDESYREVTGDVTFNLIDTVNGSTYSRCLENVVAFGPRFPDKGYACHIANEFISEKDFYDMIEIYFRALKKLLGVQ